MADKRIFNLTEATTAGDNDLLALDNSNFPETKKIKVSKLKAADAQKLDITSLYNLTGTTNTTGSTIHKGTFFYLNGSLSVALADIAPGATFTFDTNYVATTVGDELTDVKQTLTQIESIDSEEISARQRYNVKNILPIKWASQTQRGVTFTRHIDDSYTLSGTCTGNPLTIDLFSVGTYNNTGDTSNFNIVDGIKIDKSKPYILTRSDTQIRFTLVLYQDETSVATVGFNNTGGSSYMEIDFSQYTFNKIKAVVRFGNNTNYDGKTFKPMLCLKSDYEVSTSQQPYAKTNSQLTTVCPAMEFNIITNGYRLQFARYDGLIFRFDLLTSGTNAGKFYVNLIDKNGESKYYHNFTPNT